MDFFEILYCSIYFLSKFKISSILKIIIYKLNIIKVSEKLIFFIVRLYKIRYFMLIVMDKEGFIHIQIENGYRCKYTRYSRLRGVPF